MPGSWPVAALAASLLLGLGWASAASAGASICGVADGQAGDLSRRQGEVSVVCDQPGGHFVGTIRVERSWTIDRILVSGVMTGKGSLTFSANYDSARFGEGSEGAALFGQYRAGDPVTAGSVTLSAFATSFSANSASAASDTAGRTVLGSDLRAGRFSGRGTLTGSLTWDAGSGAIDLGGSMVQVYTPLGDAAKTPAGVRWQEIYPSGPGWTGGRPGGVPEPSAWALMVLGFGAIGGALRRRRAAAA